MRTKNLAFLLLLTASIHPLIARDFGAGFGTGTVFGLTTGAILGAATNRPRETVVVREQAPTTTSTRVVRRGPSSSRSILDDLNDLRDQVDDLTNDLNDAEDYIENLHDTIDNLKTQNRALVAENKELRTKISSLKSEKKITEQKEVRTTQPSIVLNTNKE